MSKVAVDTNIMLYALDEFYPAKQKIAIDVLADHPYFCSQNLSEFINVCLRRRKLPKTDVGKLIITYLQQCRYIPVSEQMLTKSLDIMTAYDFQLFDSIIVAAALDTGCTTLYSEDMHDGQLIDKQLKIVNPFKA
jgi:predicted nucleic acid-binding protein